jgi:hypothetical protein
MSDTAFLDTTEALRQRIGLAVGGTTQVWPGPPVRTDVGSAKVSLFLFHTRVNSELRNESRFSFAPPLEPSDTPAGRVDALPFDLYYLISVFRQPDSATTPNELQTLGQLVRVLHERPTITGEALDGQVVRVTPEPYPMEELSRIWGLFPRELFRTSMVYRATPVFVEAGPYLSGRPVVDREQHTGQSKEPQDISGRRREQLAREGEDF